MKLLEVTVNKFRNILDSSPVKIQHDITCFVGKNESGKTSFLHALYRLNPARPNVNFKVEDHYPAWLEKKDRMKGDDLEKFKPVSATFEIEAEIIEEVNSKFGDGVMLDNILRLKRAYNGEHDYSFNLDHKAAIKSLLRDLTFSKETRSEISNPEIKHVEDLNNAAAALTFTEENTKDRENIAELLKRIKIVYGANSLSSSIWTHIKPKVPKFIYFDKYSSLPYTVKIKELLQANKSTLKDDELTALALLKMAGADDDYLLNPDYERRKRELENVANALTQDVLKYWSQNRELRVSPDITQRTESQPNGQTAVVNELKIRI